MNAGGVPNTCKSNGLPGGKECFGVPSCQVASGGWVSNTWVIYPGEGDNSSKGLLIPRTFGSPRRPEERCRFGGGALG